MRGTTVYAAGGLWEETLGGARRAVYTLQGRAVAQRDGATGQVLYLHGDHLGSVSAVTDQQGQVVSRQQYDPWGAPRGGEGIGERETTLDFTGQRRDGTGLLYYGARYYDPQVGRFLSPDTIVPGVADAKGGMAATLGSQERMAHTLTVGFHEPAFAAQLGAEHRFTLAEGFGFQLDEGARREAKYAGGPPNPQALNRYAYVLNNPLRYTDPTGHAINDGRVINEGTQPVLLRGERDESRPGCDAAVEGANCLVWEMVLYPGQSSDELGFKDVDSVRALPGQYLHGFGADMQFKIQKGSTILIQPHDFFSDDQWAIGIDCPKVICGVWIPTNSCQGPGLHTPCPPPATVPTCQDRGECGNASAAWVYAEPPRQQGGREQGATAWAAEPGRWLAERVQTVRHSGGATEEPLLL